MRVCFVALFFFLVNLSTAGWVSAQPLVLDPAFMAAVGTAQCWESGPGGTHCQTGETGSPLASLVTLAHDSATCRLDEPWHICADGVGVFDKMVARGGDRTTNVTFDYVADELIFVCNAGVSYFEGSKTWDSDVWCHWQNEEKKDWVAAVLPGGAYLIAVNGGTYVSVLCDGEGPVLSYNPHPALLPSNVPPEGTEFELGFSRDAPKEPPPYETTVRATSQLYAFHLEGEGVRDFLFTASKARRYMDIGVLLPDGAVNTQLIATGSTAAVGRFLQACP